MSVDLPALGRPDDGDAQRFGRVELAAVLVVRQHQLLARFLFVFGQRGGFRQRLEQRCVKFGESVAMFGGKDDRIAQAESVKAS